MLLGADGNAVDADLCRHIAVAHNAVGGDEHHVDLAQLHQQRGGVVADEGIRHAHALEVKGVDLGSLHTGSCLICIDVYGLTLLHRRIHNAHAQAVVNGTQGACGAVGMDIGARFGDQRRTELTDALCILYLLVGNAVGNADKLY